LTWILEAIAADRGALVTDHGNASTARTDGAIEQLLREGELAGIGGLDRFEQPALGAALGTAVIFRLRHDDSSRGGRAS
jgi:hypothetical protein